MMTKFEEHLIKQHQNQAYLISDNDQEGKSKEEYIQNAEVGLIVAFRLHFESKSKTKLSKVISGKILKNNTEDKLYTVETRNGLKYGVPYDAVVWVKTGNRWPKGVYEEMKRGAVEVKDQDGIDFGGMDDNDHRDHQIDSEWELEDK